MYCWAFFYYSLFFIIRCVQHLRLTPSSLLLHIITITVVERSFYGSRQNSNALICVSLMPTLIQVSLHITLSVRGTHYPSSRHLLKLWNGNNIMIFNIFYKLDSSFLPHIVPTFPLLCIIVFCDRDDEDDDDAPLRISDMQYEMLYIHIHILIPKRSVSRFVTATFLLHVHHLRFGTPKCVYDRDHVLLLILLRTFDGSHLERACKWKSSFFMRTAKKSLALLA